MPHLDHVFDYIVPASLDGVVKPGVRVRVRFSGRLVDGYVTARSDTCGTNAKLKPIDKVVSPEVVLTEPIMQLIEATADRYAGTFSDVVRAAVPARHATVESEELSVGEGRVYLTDADRQGWSRYAYGLALIDGLARDSKRSRRLVWSQAPGQSWSRDVASLVRAVCAQPTGSVVVVVPDARALGELKSQMHDVQYAGLLAVLSSDLGPAGRYRQFLRCLRGAVRVVIGTRSAVFAPMQDLRLIIVWDDGDESLTDPHAPYWNARDVAVLRAHAQQVALAIGSPARSIAGQQLCESGWATSVVPSRAGLTINAPMVRGVEPNDHKADTAANAARIPHRAWAAAKAALAHGPVLVQVARTGYLPALGCARCREPARCECGGPITKPDAAGTAQCGWCRRQIGLWDCPKCHGQQFRALSVGIERTAEEFGRAFPGVQVIWSTGSQPRSHVSASPALIVATAGVEPLADGGYACVLILDARGQLSRPHLDASEEAIRRWMSAAILARPKATVVVTADNTLPVLQSMVRWDAAGLAERELAERYQARLPPATRMIVLAGASADIDDLLQRITTPHQVLGSSADQRVIVVTKRDDGLRMSRELRSIAAVRSAHRGAGVVNVVCDPRRPDWSP